MELKAKIDRTVYLSKTISTLELSNQDVKERFYEPIMS